jgi:MFS family permease
VRSALALPRLRRIVAAYTINRLGTWFGSIALSLAVFDHTHSALAVAAVLVASQVFPALIVPAVVARVEASRRRRELSALYAFEALATAALAVLAKDPWLPAVLVLVALDGTAALAASALLRTETARAARELAGPTGDEDAAEQKANAALNVAFSLTFVLGPALAGALVASAGAPVALLLDSVSFLICGALLLDLHPHVDEASGESVRARLRAAWSHVRSVPALRLLLLTQAVALVFFEAGAPVEVAYAKVTLHAGDRGFGLLVTSWGVGVVIGSIVYARVGTGRLGTMLVAGTIGVGAAYLGLAAAPTLAVACAVAVVGGLGNGVQWAPVVGGVQRLTPHSLLGRVMGALEALGALAPAFGFALGGALVAVSSPRTALVVIGAAACLTTIGFARVRLNRTAEPDAAAPEEPEPMGALAAPTAASGVVAPHEGASLE